MWHLWQLLVAKFCCTVFTRCFLISHNSSGCFESGLSTAVHEMLHTLGFEHEHNRPDRDEYVSVKWRNIQPRKVFDFQKRPHGTSETHDQGSVDIKDTPYDVFSVLHYGPQVYSISKCLTRTGFHLNWSTFLFSGFHSEWRRRLDPPSWTAWPELVYAWWPSDRNWSGWTMHLCVKKIK